MYAFVAAVLPEAPHLFMLSSWMLRQHLRPFILIGPSSCLERRHKMSTVKLAHQLSILVAVLVILAGCGGPSAPATSSLDAMTPSSITVRPTAAPPIPMGTPDPAGEFLW